MTLANAQGGSVYFIQNRATNNVKIGYTRQRVKKRRQALQTGCDGALEVIHIIDDVPQDVEDYLHHKFNDLHVRGEWFRAGGDLCEYVTRGTMPATSPGCVSAKSIMADCSDVELCDEDLFILLQPRCQIFALVQRSAWDGGWVDCDAGCEVRYREWLLCRGCATDAIRESKRRVAAGDRGASSAPEPAEDVLRHQLPGIDIDEEWLGEYRPVPSDWTRKAAELCLLEAEAQPLEYQTE